MYLRHCVNPSICTSSFHLHTFLGSVILLSEGSLLQAPSPHQQAILCCLLQRSAFSLQFHRHSFCKVFIPLMTKCNGKGICQRSLHWSPGPFCPIWADDLKLLGVPWTSAPWSEVQSWTAAGGTVIGGSRSAGEGRGILATTGVLWQLYLSRPGRQHSALLSLWKLEMSSHTVVHLCISCRQGLWELCRTLAHALGWV